MRKRSARHCPRRKSIHRRETGIAGICFVPDGKYSEFIDRYLAHEIVPMNCRSRRDRHAKGEKMASIRAFIVTRSASGAGLESRMKTAYVLQIERARNQIIVGEKDELDSLEFVAKGVNWIALRAAEPVRADVKVRYRHDPAPRPFTLSKITAPGSYLTSRSARSRRGSDVFLLWRGSRWRRLDREI